MAQTARRNDGFNKASRFATGFTLIELLIVIAIIGVLSTIAMVGTNYVRSRARDARRVTDARTVQKALELYQTSNGKYPAAAADTCITNSDAVSTALKNANAITQLPTDPLPIWAADPAHCYLYKATDGATYSLQYYLETNSQTGTVGLHTVTQ